jgi:hypothetical protein
MIYGAHEKFAKDQAKVNIAIYQKYGSFAETNSKYGLGYQRMTSDYNSNVVAMERESIGIKLTSSGYLSGTNKY